MLLTNNEELYEKAKKLRDMAFIKERRFVHHEIGFNYRMTNMQAAVGLAQLEQIENFVEARRRNAKLYNELLKDVEGITLPPEKEWVKNVYWMYSILIDEERFGINRDQLMNRLNDKGIETRPFFVPMNQQPVLQKLGFDSKNHYSISEMLSNFGINLPSSSSISNKDIIFICNEIKNAAI